jgi:integrase
MARKSTGSVFESEVGDGTRSYAIRFRVNGQRQYRTLGYSSEGWTRKRAEEELANVMADVRRGMWREPEPDPVPVPSFYEFAEQWFEAQRLEGGQKGKGLTPKGEEDLRWRLEVHLLPYFVKTLKDPRLDEITVEDVDRYRQAKVRDGKLGPTSINKTLATLASILEQAVEYGHIPRNPAKGKRRRLHQPKPQRTFLDRADHIAALLNGAGQRDADARTRRGQRRALIATLVFAGLRIGEALALRWRDVDLARGVIRVRDAKTDAGVRTVNMLPVLRDELLGFRARLADPSATDLVFATTSGGRLSETNIRRRIIAKAVELANTALLEADGDPIEVRLTPHSLRRTFASLLFAIGEDAPYVMQQMGHTTSNLTLEVYARAMHRRDGEKERLAALVRGDEWAAIDQSALAETAEVSNALPLETEKPAEKADFGVMGGDGLEPPTSWV